MGRLRTPIIPHLDVAYRLAGETEDREIRVENLTLSAFESHFKDPYTVVREVEGRVEMVPWMVWKQCHEAEGPFEAFFKRVEGCWLLGPDPDDAPADGDESPLAKWTLADLAMMAMKNAAIRASVQPQGS